MIFISTTMIIDDSTTHQIHFIKHNNLQRYIFVVICVNQCYCCRKLFLHQKDSTLTTTFFITFHSRIGYSKYTYLKRWLLIQKEKKSKK